MSDSPHILQGGVAVDDRGSVRFVNDFDFKDVKRFYQVQNHRQGFIRAWHGHQHEAKYVYVASGSALIGAANMETQVVEKFVLSSQSPKVLFIPAGYANGFKTLEENTIILPKINYDFKITLSKTDREHSAFVDWAEKNTKVKLTKTCKRELLRDRSWGGTYFYVTGENNLLLTKMHLGGSINKVERIIKA